MLIDKSAPYYDDYTQSKNYVQMLALPGRALQAREFTQLGSSMMDFIGRLGDASYSSGTIISGCTLVISGKTATISAGRIYLEGLVRIVPESTVTITGSGAEVIGAKIVRSVVTEDTDTSLLDPAQGYQNYNQSGCHRVKEDVQFFLNDSASTTVYNLLDGELQTNSSGTETSTITDMLARRTYDESGNYKIRGLELQDRSETSDGKIMLTLTSGKAYIKGYEVTKSSNSLIKLGYSQTTRSVVSESKMYNTGTLKYAIINQPVKQINSVTTQVSVTETITRGNITGGIDYLTHTPVVSITSITSGSTTYTEGKDYQLTTDGIDWSLSGSEPSIGTTYICKYIYNKKLVAETDYNLVQDSSDSNYYFVLTGTGDLPVDKSYIYLNYDFYLSRKDLILLDMTGTPSVVEGIPDISRLAESPINQDENKLIIGVVTVSPNASSISISNTNTTRLTEDDLFKLLKRVNDLEYNQAISDLDQEAIDGESATSLNGIFTDGFVGLTKCDIGHADFNCTIDLDNNELTLPSNQYLIKATPNTSISATNVSTLGRIISAPYTESLAISQAHATDTLLVNPYAVYSPMSLITLNPAIDNWIDTQYITAYQTRTQSVTLRRWWYHRGESWAESEYQKYLAYGVSASSQNGWGSTTGTTTTSTQSVVYDNVETYMRSIKVAITGSNFSADADNIICYFNNTKIPLTPTGSTVAGSAGTGSVKADSSGKFTAEITVPANTPSGSVEVLLTCPACHGSAIYQSEGRTQIIQNTVLTTKTTVNPTDPLAQSFSFDTDTIVTKIGLYFAAKDSKKSVYIQIRNMVNGSPGTTCHADVIVSPDDIKTSTDSSVETTVTLNQPLYCSANEQYCICILSDSNAYAMFIGTLGKKDLLTSQYVTSQPYTAGVLFSSSNALTWTADQTSDLKFNIYKATYTGVGTLIFNNISTDYITRLVLAAQSIDYANAGIAWYYRLTDTSAWLPLSTYVDRDLSVKADTIALKAELNLTSSTNTSPLLAGDCINLIGFIDKTQGTYISRTVTMESAFTSIRLMANISAPTGTSVKFYYMTDAETTWTQITDTPTITAVDTEFSTYEYIHKCTSAKTYKLKIVMETSSVLTRPRIKKLINILRF